MYTIAHNALSEIDQYLEVDYLEHSQEEMAAIIREIIGEYIEAVEKELSK